MTSPGIEIPVGVKLHVEAARRLGMTVEILDPEYGFLFELRHNDRAITMVGGRSPLNDAVAARIAQDKYFTGLVLQRAGFHTPTTVRCLKADHFHLSDYSDRDGATAGIAFAETHGYPVIVKPNQRSHGLDVIVARNRTSLTEAIERIWRFDYLALVQKPVEGEDLRLDFLNGEFLAGYRRHACTLAGDGARTMRELLHAVRPAMARTPERWRWMAEDSDWQREVMSRGWNEDSVPPPGAVIQLGDTIRNLNRWAVAEVLDDLPDAWLAFARRIGKAMRLSQFGIDVRTQSLDEDPDEATIIEVNASPSLVQIFTTGHAELAIQAQMRVLQAIFERPC